MKTRMDIDVLVLAGGKSSRMGGQHKGELRIGEETFAEHVIGEAEKFADNVWISCGEECQEIYSKYQVVRDIYKDCGPMGGIHAGLLAAKSEYVFVLACDMPFFDNELVKELQKYMSDNPAIIVPRINGRIHPLAALYKKSIHPFLEKQIVNGNYKMRSLLELVKTVYVELEEEPWNKILQNINTVDEYKELQKLRYN